MQRKVLSLEMLLVAFALLLVVCSLAQHHLFSSHYLDKGVRELKEVVVGQPQLSERALQRRSKHLVSQGL